MAQAYEERFQVRSFPTPLPIDLIFYQIHEAKLPKNQKFEYGSPHPDKIQFPNHVLSLVTPHDQEGLQKRFYVAKRQDQDLYNWEFSDADIKGNKFRLVNRTYITPRSEYTVETPLMGEAMPNLPVGKFEMGNEEPVLFDYVLSERKQVTAQQEELNSIFVMEVRSFVKRAPISNVQLDIQTGNSKRSVTNLYYRGEVVDGVRVEILAENPNGPYWGLQADGVFRELEQVSDTWFAITESTAIPTGGPLGGSNPAKTRVQTRPTPIVGDIIFYETGPMPSPSPAYGSAHYDSANWPNHKLSFIRPADKTGLLFEFVYVADRANQDNYNWEITQADIGNTRFNAVTRTYVTPRGGFLPDTPSQGTAMASPVPAASGTYILAERKQSRTDDPQIDNLYVIDTHTYVVRETISDITTDRTLGVGVQQKTTLFFKGESGIESLFDDPENSYWGVQSNGVTRDGKQLTANWFAVIETSSRDAALLAYKLSIPTRTNLDLPNVLESIGVTWNTASRDSEAASNWTGLASWDPAENVHARLGGSESSSSGSSASIQPSLVINIKSPIGKGIQATAYFFYLKSTSQDEVTSSEFVARINTLFGVSVQFWPTFTPESHSIALSGQKASVQAQTSVNSNIAADGNSVTGEGAISADSLSGSGESYDFSTMNEVVRIPPTIHGVINLSGSTTNSATVVSNCSSEWNSIPPAGSIAGQAIQLPPVSVSSTATATASGSVFPASLPATNPSRIPNSGFYVVDSKIEPYEAGWVRCYAEVIDASNI